jgi:type III secretion system YscD/HrpQ family protein
MNKGALSSDSQGVVAQALTPANHEQKSGLSFVLIKILSGLHAGAEMEIAPGDWLVGRDESCDVLLMDESIAPRHVLLRVEADGSCAAWPQNGQVMLENADGSEVQKLGPDGSALPDLAVLLLGTGTVGISLAIGPAARPWPDWPTSKAPVAEPALQNSAGPTSEQISLDPSSPSNQIGDCSSNEVGGQQGWRFNAADHSPDQTISGRSAAKKFGEKVRRLVVPVLTVVLVLVLILEVKKDATEAMEQALHDGGFTGLTAHNIDGGGVLLRGFVSSNSELEVLMRHVENLSPQPDLAVVSLEDLSVALMAQAKRANAALRIVRSRGGLTLYGYIYDQETLHKLFTAELDNLELLTEAKVWRQQLRTWTEAKAEIERILQSHHFAGRYVLAPESYRIILRVRSLAERELESLHRAVREIDDYFNVEGAIKVERWVAPPGSEPNPSSNPQPPPSAPPPEPVISVTLPARPIRVVNGCADLSLRPEEEGSAELGKLSVIFEEIVYREGAFLPGGLQVRVITPAYIALRDGNLTIICNANELASSQLPRPVPEARP